MIPRNAIITGPVYLHMTADSSSFENESIDDSTHPDCVFDMQGIKFAAGGKTAEIGLALHRLDTPTRLIGKVGDDRLGKALIESLQTVSPDLTRGMVTDPSVRTGAVIQSDSLEGSIIFPGANKMFYASDIPRADLQDVDLFHFTDPAAMRSVYRGEGGELVSILQRARRKGLTTSLDINLPESNGSSGVVDWTLVLENSLCDVDLFFVDGIDLVCLYEPERQDTFKKLITADLLHDLSGQVLSFGVEAVLIRLGSHGAYLRTASAKAWKKAGRALLGFSENWHDREFWVPAFKGSCDETMKDSARFAAGFLASLLRATEPEAALLTAAAAQASRKEQTWEDIQAHLDLDWATLPLDVAGEGWRKEGPHDLWQKT